MQTAKQERPYHLMSILVTINFVILTLCLFVLPACYTGDVVAFLAGMPWTFSSDFTRILIMNYVVLMIWMYVTARWTLAGIVSSCDQFFEAIHARIFKSIFGKEPSDDDH